MLAARLPQFYTVALQGMTFDPAHYSATSPSSQIPEGPLPTAAHPPHQSTRVATQSAPAQQAACGQVYPCTPGVEMALAELHFLSCRCGAGCPPAAHSLQHRVLLAGQ
jgi:hypothetical protein